MAASLRALPSATYDQFVSDPRNLAAAESYLRRALEALLDLCRHVLSKGFGEAPSEYKGLAPAATRAGVLSAEQDDLLRRLAGYRNRMVRFYQEVASTGSSRTWTTCWKRCYSGFACIRSESSGGSESHRDLHPDQG
jgi:uncharacterized protein YutE (UPF0331/DUF86 family)